jgi:cytochrome P450
MTPEPPKVRTRYPGEAILKIRKSPLDFLKSVGAQYGDAAQIRFGPERLFFFNHPDAIREIFITQPRSFEKGFTKVLAVILGNGLLNSEGDVHLQQRRMMQPSFHREKIAAYAKLMVESLAKITDNWSEGKTIDVAAEMPRLTMKVTAQALFGQDIETDAPHVWQQVEEMMPLVESLTSPVARIKNKLPLPSSFRTRRALAAFKQTFSEHIAKRRADRTEQRSDVLELLLNARDVDGDGSMMNDEQIRDQVITLFVAGFETTATALTWAWHLVATHSSIDEALAKEAASLPETLTASDFSRMPVALNVFLETLRLYPPAWIYSRRAIRDSTLLGYRVPKGTMLIVSPYMVHHDARYFERPEQFLPERWTSEARAAKQKLIFAPFGAGSRQCIGEGFAMMLGVLTLGHIARRFKLIAHSPTIRTKPLVTLRPDGAVPMTLVRRAQSV